VGFRERVGAPRRLGLALASITLTAALIVGFNAVDLSQISLAVPQFSRTIALPIAALTLIGPGRSANPIEKMGALVLIVFAIFSTLVGGLRLADCGCDTNGGRATLLIGLPVLFIGTGLVAVLIMAADLAHQLRGVARLDPLTEALNRRGFEEAASRALMRMRRQERASTLVLLDLDHFKSINDRFGHARGDDVLQAVAQCVRREIRDADLFSRIGGEEFAILLDGSDVPTAFTIAERIRKAILALPCLPDREPITASFGIAPIGSESLLIPAMAQADLALYQAKSLGRNRSCVYAPESAQEATTRQMQTFAGESA
jgi:diguanylate cyclase (GGDEF)-like protein